MKKIRKRIDNKGFSMIELIVIMAIMTVAVGASVMSVSLVTGSEAKKAAQKMDSMLNEVKTGSMSRLDEDITIVYKTRDTSVADTPSGSVASGSIDKDGYYAVLKSTTLTTKSGTGSGTSSGAVRYAEKEERPLGVENRLLGDSRVYISLYREGSSDPITLKPDGSNSITIKYDRATGNVKEALVTGSGVGKPDRIVFSTLPPDNNDSGKRTYTIVFNTTTGRHRLEK